MVAFTRDTQTQCSGIGPLCLSVSGEGQLVLDGLRGLGATLLSHRQGTTLCWTVCEVWTKSGTTATPSCHFPLSASLAVGPLAIGIVDCVCARVRARACVCAGGLLVSQ